MVVAIEDIQPHEVWKKKLKDWKSIAKKPKNSINLEDIL